MTASPEADLVALEAFLVNNPEFEKLEALLDQFNLFEAIGVVNQEVRHSDFLAFLLDPRQTHGLGDAFLRRLLQHVVGATSAADLPATRIDLALWDLQAVEVRREWQNIDILVLDPVHRLVVIIENKIRSGEQEGQLKNYLQAIHDHYASFKIISLYLSPSGAIPSHEAYLPISYNVVCKVIEDLARTRGPSLGPDVLTVLDHYTRLLRRHFVGGSEIAHLCRRIYQKHQRALDLIRKHVMETHSWITSMTTALIENAPRLTIVGRFNHGEKCNYIQFAAIDWDILPLRTSSMKWWASGQSVVFEFVNSVDKLSLKLTLSPDLKAKRQQLLNLAHNNPHLFRNADASVTKWTVLSESTILDPQDYMGASNDQLEAKIRAHWAHFLRDDLPAIVDAVLAEVQTWPATSEGAGPDAPIV